MNTEDTIIQDAPETDNRSSAQVRTYAEYKVGGDVNIRVYDAKCYGCIRHESDIMLTLMTGTQFQDIFMTNDQAIRLTKDLADAVIRNQANATK